MGFLRAASCAVVGASLLLASPALSQSPAANPGDGTTIIFKRAPQPGAPAGIVTWDKIAGNWKAFRGRIRQQWGKLTHNDIEIAKGKRDALVGKIQARYGIDKDKADQQVDLWLKQQ
jgi:uncharacterized protein YjbJ (UPF0337 family)